MAAKKSTILFILITLLSPGLFGQHGEYLEAELWIQRDPFLGKEEISIEENRELIAILLDEVKWVFSGMIYGFSFVYRPSDRNRGAEEYFSLEPKGEIPSGDPRLQVGTPRIVGNRVYVDFRYPLESHQQLRRNSWMSNAFPDAQGRGTGRYFSGPEEKLTAHGEGIKLAAREYVRERHYNKPKEINGEALLISPPRTIVKAGEYISQVSVKLNIKEIKEYVLY